jgi:hypothetical protein
MSATATAPDAPGPRSARPPGRRLEVVLRRPHRADARDRRPPRPGRLRPRGRPRRPRLLPAGCPGHRGRRDPAGTRPRPSRTRPRQPRRPPRCLLLWGALVHEAAHAAHRDGAGGAASVRGPGGLADKPGAAGDGGRQRLGAEGERGGLGGAGDEAAGGLPGVQVGQVVGGQVRERKPPLRRSPPQIQRTITSRFAARPDDD